MMVDWQVVGALAELVGGIAVVGSLILFGSPLRQQANIERAKAERELLAAAREWVSLRTVCAADAAGSRSSLRESVTT